MLADSPRTTNLSVGVHPLELLRRAYRPGVISSTRSRERRRTARRSRSQAWPSRGAQPATANGVVFMLIEDEFGAVNLIVPPVRSTTSTARSSRGEPLILARGRFERDPSATRTCSSAR